MDNVWITSKKFIDFDLIRPLRERSVSRGAFVAVPTKCLSRGSWLRMISIKIIY